MDDAYAPGALLLKQNLTKAAAEQERILEWNHWVGIAGLSLAGFITALAALLMAGIRRQIYRCLGS